MIKLYDSKLSGNAWKIRLLLRYLGRPFERVTLNLAEGKHKSAEFMEKNGFQRIPVLELEDGTCLSESAAILLHLAEGTNLLPADPIARAQVMSWMFYEQADLMRFFGYPRFYKIIGQYEAKADIIAHYHEIATSAITALERALTKHDWAAGTQLTVADFALYAYISLAPEGGFDLSRTPAVLSWIARFEALPAYEPLVPDMAA